MRRSGRAFGKKNRPCRRTVGDAPSGRSAASFRPRDSSILGSNSATHSTRHVASVSFWNVEMAMATRRTETCRWSEARQGKHGRRVSSIRLAASFAGGTEVSGRCSDHLLPLDGDRGPPKAQLNVYNRRHKNTNYCLADT